jgi:hypothetical protein
VSAPDFHHVAELFALAPQSGQQLCKGRIQPLAYERNGGQVDCRGNDIVAGLAEINVIVGVDRLFSPPFSGKHFVCAAGDHLVRVHVGRSPRSSLENVKNKIAVENALDHLTGGGANRSSNFG